MLFTIKEIQDSWKITPKGVIHVGAHEGEEAAFYELNKWLPVLWIEAQPNLSNDLREKLNGKHHVVVNAAIWESDDSEINLNITSNGASSSLLELGTHKNHYPEIQLQSEIKVKTTRLDTLLNQISPGFEHDVLNLDIQGAEFEAIKSLGMFVNKFLMVYTEVNKEELYINCKLIGDMDKLLEENGFKRVATRWVLGKGWGDAIYIHNKVKAKSVVSVYKMKLNTLKFYVVSLWAMSKLSISKLI